MKAGFYRNGLCVEAFFQPTESMGETRVVSGPDTVIELEPEDNGVKLSINGRVLGTAPINDFEINGIPCTDFGFPDMVDALKDFYRKNPKLPAL